MKWKRGSEGRKNSIWVKFQEDLSAPVTGFPPRLIEFPLVRGETTKRVTSTPTRSLFPKNEEEEEEGDDFGPPAGNNRIEVQICGSRNRNGRIRTRRVNNPPPPSPSDSQAKLSFPPTVIPSPILLSNFFPLSRNSSPPTNSNLKRIPIPISFLISLNPYYPPSRLISLKAFNPDESFSDFENTFSKYLSESSFNPRIKVAANAGRGWKKIPYPRNLFSLESKKIELSVSTIHNRSIHFS